MIYQPPKPQIYGLNQINDIAEQLFLKMSSCKIFTFAGPLGAGKTTLIRLMLTKAGIKEHITSPTFNYVNIYQCQGIRYYHFDVYRIKSLDSFCESGFDEYLYSKNSICLIEWPEIIMPLLDHSVCRCTIDYQEAEMRTINIECS